MSVVLPPMWRLHPVMDEIDHPTAACCGLPPLVGDHVRIDRRAADTIPVGALLRVMGVRPAVSIQGWAYLDVLILTDPSGEPAGSAEVLVPVASVVVYRR